MRQQFKDLIVRGKMILTSGRNHHVQKPRKCNWAVFVCLAFNLLRLSFFLRFYQNHILSEFCQIIFMPKLRMYSGINSQILLPRIFWKQWFHCLSSSISCFPKGTISTSFICYISLCENILGMYFSSNNWFILLL